MPDTKSNAEIVDNDVVEDWHSRLIQYRGRLTRDEGLQLCASHIALQSAISTAQADLARAVMSDINDGISRDRLRDLFTKLGIEIKESK